MLTKSFNITLRLATLAIRFIFILVLAKFLPVAEMGNYGYLTAVIGYFIYVAGFEYYTFANREMIKSRSEKDSNIIFNQLSLYLYGYLFFLPILVLFLIWARFEGHIILIIVSISILEHLCQEWNRILISIEKVTSATVVLFFRGGIWAIVASLVMFFSPSMRTLNFVLSTWLISLALALLISICATPKRLLKFKADKEIILKGLVTCSTLFVASLATRGVVTFDRIAIEIISTKEVLAAYSVYSTVGNAIIATVDAAIVSFMFPKIVLAAQNKNMEEFLKQLKTFSKGCVLVSTVSSLTLIILMDNILLWYSSDAYSIYKPLFYGFLFFCMINVFSLQYHIALYSLNRDKHILISTLAGFLIYTLIMLYTVIFSADVYYVLAALITSSLTTFMLKLYYYRIELKKWKESITLTKK
ncbi:lipopolysaccharide biosynthesis protein [Vibrio fluvialis]|uniref:lipopolysaccharide biosynthesis protein n=1 Tax=Vibrio fluvialis TaxID=676 RepID=UPI000C21D7AF|nr:hypothetical protein [Vibrio fluvialis]MBL4240376.1 hypothetical protein [Vibrio fluvialis]MBL4275333.1 hypothetical protein [Vibrio fluvialis]MBO1442497.1 hypothetical protein [Vibrio fluvialis]MBO1446803.1 hypothetical protein [Vibrio fluvialis]MBO1451194.1 hypothetical protein [Vibrio fluvialis]